MASSNQTVLQFTPSSTILTAKVHPLVMFNICDCFVRRPDQAERVIGTLLGSVLPDSTVDIRNCYAVPHNESSDQAERIKGGDFLLDFTGSSNRSLLGIRSNNPMVVDCSEIASLSLCSQKPNKCKWCRNEAIDDMCFSKSKAWRLPPQVFSCD